MDQTIFVCKLCGKEHLSTVFEHGVAKFLTTATTVRNSKGEWYILCKTHEEAKQKDKHSDAQQCGEGHDCSSHRG